MVHTTLFVNKLQTLREHLERIPLDATAGAVALRVLEPLVCLGKVAVAQEAAVCTERRRVCGAQQEHVGCFLRLVVARSGCHVLR